jgi:hypothetical protein
MTPRLEQFMNRWSDPNRPKLLPLPCALAPANACQPRPKLSYDLTPTNACQPKPQRSKSI